MRRSAVIACAVLALPAARPASAINEAEQRARIAYQANQSTHIIDELGLLFQDPQLDAYLQGIVDRMYPEFAGKLHVQTFKNSAFNAFAMPNGQLYMHTGTLLRLTNEAQLASVLGHEGAHYTKDHIYRSIVSAKSTMPVLTVLGAALGVPALGQLAGVSSIMGMSREHETEADEEGFARMTRIGYAASGGAESFRHLLREIDSQKIKQPYFFASHPRISERIANFVALEKSAPAGGETNTERYLAATLKARLAALDAILHEGNGKLLVHLLEEQQLLDTLPAYCRYHLAEGHRIRNAPGDGERALALYRETIAGSPEFAPAYSALGQRLMHDGDKAGALPLLRRYLELAPDAPDKAFIEMYVASLEKETTP